MTPTKEQFDRLSHLSEQINKKADDLGEKILEVEKQLQQCGFSVPLWLDEILQCEEQIKKSNNKAVRRCLEGHQIGWQKVGPNWRIVACPWYYESLDYIDSTDSEVIEDRQDGDVVPLANASRSIRAEAGPLLDLLVDEAIKTLERLQKKLQVADEAAKTKTSKSRKEVK